MSLNLEPTALPLSSGLLELPSLGANIRLGVTVWHTRSGSKMLHSFTWVLRSSKKNLTHKKNQKVNHILTTEVKNGGRGVWVERNITVFCPKGALRASWSKVKHSPPAFSIRALALSVNLKAVTLIAGISCTLKSSVIVPTKTAILSSYHINAREIMT